MMPAAFSTGAATGGRRSGRGVTRVGAIDAVVVVVVVVVGGRPCAVPVAAASGCVGIFEMDERYIRENE